MSMFYTVVLPPRKALSQNWIWLLQAFFITPAAEKTKTQGKNSSQKLKEKTQLQGGFYHQFRKLKKKTKMSSKNS